MTVPDDLGVSGAKLWRSITNDYDLREDEVEILHSAARVRDTIDVLTEALTDQPLIVLGSSRQPVVQPLLAERRFQEQALAGLLAKLKFHDSVETVTTSDGKMTRSESGRKAANARWARSSARHVGDDRTSRGGS